jgi:hypothetical protein
MSPPGPSLPSDPERKGSAELVVLEGMTHDATALFMGDSDGPLYAAVKSLLDTGEALP